jgi:glycerol-3-phosphate dehydrogenase
VDLAVERLRRRADRCLTDQVSLLEEVHPLALDQWHDLTRQVDPERLTRLLTRYGASALKVLRLMARHPELGRSVCPHHDVTEAEIVHAAQSELACTVTDALARRTRIAWSPCQGLDALSRIVELLEGYGPSPAGPAHQQVEAYHRFLERGLAFRHGRSMNKVAA